MITMMKIARTMRVVELMGEATCCMATGRDGGLPKLDSIPFTLKICADSKSRGSCTDSSAKCRQYSEEENMKALGLVTIWSFTDSLHISVRGMLHEKLLRCNILIPLHCLLMIIKIIIHLTRCNTWDLMKVAQTNMNLQLFICSK